MSIELGKFNQLEVVKEVDFGFPVCPFFTSASGKTRHTHAKCKHRRNTAENISFCHIPLSFFVIYPFTFLII